MLRGGQPHISLEHMRLVIGAFLVQQFRLRFPIEPAIIERSVGKANETVFNRPPRLSSASRTARASNRAVVFIAPG